ncbi:MAG TPA: GntR family transcriptional regulator [Ktedonobacteraceae bacterium]|jgi:DNA-binding GntR family transcriptional regulator|nr:GntR family transcriptional regulator [Ktedonobacteraceae bacterium]
MASSIEPEKTNEDFSTQEISAHLSAEVFETLWGHSRNALPSAVDYAYEQIWKRLIFSNEQKEQRLSDAALAEKLGVSRTPVRQALERLVQDGLVRSDPRRGFWVRTFTVQDIHEIYDLRGALEVLALRLAAPRLDPADLISQLELIRHIRERLEQQPVSLFLQCDFRLHALLVRASENSRLIHYLSALRSQFSIFQIKCTRNPLRMNPTLDDHEQILMALLENNIDKAASLLASHIVHSKVYVLADVFGEQESNT